MEAESIMPPYKLLYQLFINIETHDIVIKRDIYL